MVQIRKGQGVSLSLFWVSLDEVGGSGFGSLKASKLASIGIQPCKRSVRLL